MLNPSQTKTARSLTIQQVVRHLQGTVKCKSCGNPISGNKVFCFKCSDPDAENKATLTDVLTRHNEMEEEYVRRQDSIVRQL